MRVRCISGSRFCSLFFVELGACTIVASTIVPVVSPSPAWPRRGCLFEKVVELADRGLVGDGFVAETAFSPFPMKLVCCSVTAVWQPVAERWDNAMVIQSSSAMVGANSE